MGYYKVDFGDYCLAHHDDCTYFNHFEFRGEKYPIGSFVELTENGRWHFLRDCGYGFRRGNFRLVDHFVNNKGVEKWKYIIGKSYNSDMYYFRTTTKMPDELIDSVQAQKFDETVEEVGELKVEFKDFNYSPKDWEVEGVMAGWFVMAVVFIGAFIFKDWWLRWLIQSGSGYYFGAWRDKKINEAIASQRFKE